MRAFCVCACFSLLSLNCESQQLQHLYAQSFKEDEYRRQYRAFIIDNVITAMQILVAASFAYESCSIKSAENRATAEIVKTFDTEVFNTEVCHTCGGVVHSPLVSFSIEP